MDILQCYVESNTDLFQCYVISIKMTWCVFEAGTIVVSNYMYNYRVAIKLSKELLQKKVLL